MKKCKISIIVPVYKVEKYIGKCVASLMLQDYKNIEIILVDDGSPDDSPAVIDSLAIEDERHKTNVGVSSARNAGLSVATGDYIMFIDGDDWVEPDYVSYFLNLIKLNDCLVGMDKNNFYADSGNLINKSYTISAEEAIELIYMGQIFVSVWNKIYSTAFFKDNSLQFDERFWFGEGMLFNIECLQFYDKFVIGEKSFYYQTINPNSAKCTFNLKINFCGFQSLELQKEKCLKVNKSIENSWSYHKYCLDIAEDNIAVYYECRHNIRAQISISLKANYTLKRKLSWVTYAVFPITMAQRAVRKFINTFKNTGSIRNSLIHQLLHIYRRENFDASYQVPYLHQLTWKVV